MDIVSIGKVVNTHGIKGEIRILSHFPFKEKVFGIGKKIMIGDTFYTITSYRVHKEYDMVTLEGYTNINDVLPLLHKKVFVEKSEIDLEEDEVLDEDLISYTVLTNDGRRGIIKEIFYASETNKILRVELDHEVLIPFTSPMILKIDKEKKTILVELIEGM
ncbi:MAG: 16S rRNA processing protein RimM [Bacilli bacterium]|nr:16S rRNA processing protein RimM [Bacilli bacterium]